MNNISHQDGATINKSFNDADVKVAHIMKTQRGEETLMAASYSCGGKNITVTCIGCEAPIAKAQCARKRLESIADESDDLMMKEGLAKLVEIARRDEEQARERSIMHHHFPLSLLEYDALMK